MWNNHLHRPCLWLVCCFLVIGFSTAEAQDPAESQDAPEAPKRPKFSFTSPLTVSAGREFHMPVGRERISDHFLTLSPGTISLVGLRPRLEVSLDYLPEFEFFRNHRELDTWHHSAGFRLTSRVTPRVTFDAGDTFLATQDPSRHFGTLQLLLPRGRFRQNSAYAGLSYSWNTRTALEFRVDNSITTFTLPGDTRRGLFDNMATAGTVSISRFLTPRQKLGVGYSFARFGPLPWRRAEAPEGFRSPGPVHHVSAVYGYDNDRGLLFELSGGGIVQRDQLSYLFGSRVEKRQGEFSIAVGYQRALSFFGFGGSGFGAGGMIPDLRLSTGVLPSTVYETVTLELKAPVTRHLGVEFATLAARTDSGLAEREVRSLLGRARVSYRLAERWAIFAAGELQSQNLNSFVGVPLDRRRYFGGIEFYISPPPRTARLTRNKKMEMPGGTDPFAEKNR